MQQLEAPVLEPVRAHHAGSLARCAALCAAQAACHL